VRASFPQHHQVIHGRLSKTLQRRPHPDEKTIHKAIQQIENSYPNIRHGKVAVKYQEGLMGILTKKKPISDQNTEGKSGWWAKG
jgi:hypothetical protein